MESPLEACTHPAVRGPLYCGDENLDCGSSCNYVRPTQRCVTHSGVDCGCRDTCFFHEHPILPRSVADLEGPHHATDFQGKVDGTGYKASMDDPNKIPLWLVPVSLLRACGRALAHGAKKYAANNWRKGMAYSEVYSALQRHLGAWLEGEDCDADSGLNHLDHAAACLAFLSEYVAHSNIYGGLDDRFKRPTV